MSNKGHNKPQQQVAAGAAKEEEKGIVVGTAPMPEFLQKRMATDAGKGVSTDASDNIVPMVYILQALSPAVNKNKPEYIEGATMGDIWLRNFRTPIIPGEKGIVVQPCFFHKAWVEWRPDRGGFVASFVDRPEEAKQVADPKNPDRMMWVMPNGNLIVETRYHSVLVYPEDGGMPIPYSIPMSSTGHTISKNWMFTMNQKQANGERAASWSCLYRFKTKERTNKANQTWSTWDISDEGWVPSEAAYNAGKALFDAFSSGEKTLETPQETGEDQHVNVATDAKAEVM